MQSIHARGESFTEFLATAVRQREFWSASAARARVDPEVVERARAGGDTVHFLVLLEDWCGDAVNTVPYLARLVEQVPGWDLRVLRRDEHPALMDAHLTGEARAIPVVIVLDASFREVGWWGSRPRDLQRGVTTDGRLLANDERSREVRRWYARDRGRSTLAEVLDIVEAGRSLAAA